MLMIIIKSSKETPKETPFLMNLITILSTLKALIVLAKSISPAITVYICLEFLNQLKSIV